MPPKPAAPKEKVAKGDEAEELVAIYLKSVNRPYASTDVSANLKNKVPKAGAQKVMMTLAEKGILTKKEYGKQVIFVYNQELLEALSSEDMTALEHRTKKVLGGLDERKKGLRSTQAELNETEAVPKTKQLDRAIQQMRADNDRTLQALLPYRGEGGAAMVQPMDAKEIKKIDDDWTRWRKEWETRRKVYKELLGILSDGGQIASVPELEDDQGINVDDEEAIAVEKGEFGKPSAPLRKPIAAIKSVQAMGKRSVSSSAASSQEDASRKKKAKKA